MSLHTNVSGSLLTGSLTHAIVKLAGFEDLIMQKLNDSVSFRIKWRKAPAQGRIEILHGHLDSLAGGDGNALPGDGFAFSGSAAGELLVSASGVKTGIGAFATIVRVMAAEGPFSFFLRDALHPETPLWVAEYGVVVVPADDAREYGDIVAAIKARELESDFMRFEREPEETFEAAAARNRRQVCPTWLGIGRDIRLFRVVHDEKFGYWGDIQPWFHSAGNPIDEPATGSKGFSPNIEFVIGQGTACETRITRRLEDGCLPILTSVQTEEFMEYHLTAFATLEHHTLSRESVAGTDWRLAMVKGMNSRLFQNEADQRVADELLAESNRGESEEVVLCIRIEARNTGQAPCYAWLKAPAAGGSAFTQSGGESVLPDGRVLAVTRIDGEPAGEAETAVLVQPGNSVVFDLLIPHSPLPAERANELLRMDMDAHLTAARSYWREKLDQAAAIDIPEQPLNEIVKAALLHCDLISYGREPDGTVAPTIGWYVPIGTESAPIIQSFDMLGWHELARRCIEYFLKLQRHDGFIKTMSYEIETGAVLWTIGEHYRYTRDLNWVGKIRPNILKACDFLLDWRDKNKKEEYREKGCYGLSSGKVADNDDFYHSFMLNAMAYLGLKRAAETLEPLDADYAARLRRELTAYREDMRVAFKRAIAIAPVVPTGDGSWCPFPRQWTEGSGGALTLFADGGNWFTHGMFAGRSVSTGPLYLILAEVFEPSEIECLFLLKANQFPVTRHNAATSQPYYHRHDYAHIRRGEVKPFLKAYYNQLTGLMDQETYTFWEHYWHASQHKTAEEGWFLIQTRWMLWMEEANVLKLLSGVPRRWLADGKRISVREVSSYFGKLSFNVVSSLKTDRAIRSTVSCRGPALPSAVIIRLPHPDGIPAKRIEGGDYDAANEQITLKPFNGEAVVSAFY